MMSLPSVAAPNTTPATPDELTAKKALLGQTEHTINTNETTLIHLLDRYKKLLIRNAELIYISFTTQMDDAQMAQYTAQVNTLQSPVAGFAADPILRLVTETDRFLNHGSFLKFLVNIQETVTNDWVPPGLVGPDMTAQLLSDLGQQLYDSGIVSESGIASTQTLLTLAADSDMFTKSEVAGVPNPALSNIVIAQQLVAAATSAALAATGGAGPLTLWVDMNSPPGQSLLDKEDQKMTILTSFLDAITAKTTDINNNMVAQIGLFNQLSSDMLKLLPTGSKPDFPTSIPPALDSLDACLEAQQRAVTQFAIPAVLRDVYISILKHNPQPPRQFLVEQTMDICGVLSINHVEQVLTQISAKYSAGIASTT